MRFCPYCGAELLKEDAAFCVECGVRINPSEGKTGSSERMREGGDNGRREQPSQRRPRPEERRRNADHGKRRTQGKPNHREESRPVRRYKLDQVDDYDGYYDDIVPSDKGNLHEEIDKKLIKKIGLLIFGVLMVVSLCLLMMYAL